ncbi:MAG: DUF2726 domain-containing protein, partial [Chromatiales bacterium]|nr:DUF2726 domain-containing protein [Chromatiales bacterium]
MGENVVKTNLAISREMGAVGRIIEKEWRSRNNSSYRTVFNTHISTFFVVRHIPADLQRFALHAILPVAVINKSIGGTIRHVLLDSRDPHSQRLGQCLSLLGVKVLCLDFSDEQGIGDAYRALTTSRSEYTLRRVANQTEQALYRDLMFGLLKRPRQEDFDAIRALAGQENGPDSDYYRFAAKQSALANESLTIHPEYALAKLFDVEPGRLPAEVDKLLRTSRVDFLVTARSTENEPAFVGKPVCAVEYDGPCHSQPDQARKDEIKNDLFRQAGLPLLRVGYIEGAPKQSNLQPVRNREPLSQVNLIIQRTIAGFWDYNRSVAG